jgi:hypothetical protein
VTGIRLDLKIKDEGIKNYNLPDVLFECETWSLTLREERGLRVLMRIFEPKRDEVTGEWRKLHNEELKGDQIEMGWAYNTYGGEERRVQGFGGET